MNVDVTLNLITDTVMCGGLSGVVKTARAGVDAGATLIQVRDPHASDEEFADIASAVVRELRGSDVPVVLNDRVHLVAKTGADGAHVGQKDMPAADARQLLGPDALLGLSIHDRDQLAFALRLPFATLDYIGVGPIWQQDTKPGAEKPIGIDGAVALAQASPWPVVAIGGINLDNVGELGRQGIGVAIVSAICAAPDPGGVCEALLREWRNP